MSRPVLLDLFCGAGGAAKGYADAGFEVVGVDINPQPRYPFTFYQGDALDVGRQLLSGWDVKAVHASPPCQAHSDLQKQSKLEYVDLVPATRNFLVNSHLPYVIENVEGAPLFDPLVLCGTMFPELRVYRHRLFETSFDIDQPVHPKHEALTFTHDKRKAHYGQPITPESFIQVTGGGNAPVADKLRAMDIGWMTGKEVNQAIPPAYTRYVGQWLMAEVLTP